MIFRVDKTKDYTVMSNYHLREKNMSLKAKGLLSWMLSNDDEWDYSIAGIVSNCKENETSIKSTLRELQRFGYLEIKKCMPDKNIPTIHYEYLVHEQAIENLVLENLDVDNQVLDHLDVENQGQRNTNERNTKIRNKNERNTKEESISQPSFLGSANSLKKSQTKKDVDRFVELFNEHCTNLSKVKAITDKRKKAIQVIIKNYSWDDIITVFDLTQESDFLTGNNDRGWKANIDFILREDKFVSILEGKYNGKKRIKSADGLLTPRARKEDLDEYKYQF